MNKTFGVKISNEHVSSELMIVEFMNPLKASQLSIRARKLVDEFDWELVKHQCSTLLDTYDIPNENLSIGSV